MSKKMMVALVAGCALALAGCGDFTEGQRAGDGATGGTMTTPVLEQTAPTTSRLLPPDESVPAPHETVAPQKVAPKASPMETEFKRLTCEMLDDGYAIEDVMMGAVLADTPFSPEKVGELIVVAITEGCMSHWGQLNSFLDEMGY